MLRDSITASDADRACHRIIETFNTMVSTVIYPMQNYYSSSSEKKPLTQAEKAVMLLPIAQDLVKELKALGAPSKESKEPTMDLKTLTIETLTNDRADLVAAIGAEAVGLGLDTFVAGILSQ